MRLNRSVMITMVVMVLAWPSQPCAGQPTSPGGILLKWQDNAADETWQIIWRKQAKGNPHWYAVMSVEANVTAYLDDEVRPGREYCYQVVAEGAGGSSQPSNAACAVAP